VSKLRNDSGRRLGRLAFAGVVERGDDHADGSSGGQTVEGSFALFHNLCGENRGRIRGISYRCAILFSAARIVSIDKDAPAASSAGRYDNILRHSAGLGIARTLKTEGIPTRIIVIQQIAQLVEQAT
jgi:hypothetical protein